MARASSRWRSWSFLQSDAHPTIWVHAPSIGEALSVEPIVERLRKHQPGLRFILTHLSSSVTDWPTHRVADHADYLPIPFRWLLQRMMTQINPRLLLLPAADLWPGLIKAAKKNGTPIAVVSATVRSGSTRHSAAGLALHRSLLPLVSLVGSTTSADHDKWIALGADAARVHVTGDPRDQALIEASLSHHLPRTVSPWVVGHDCVVLGSLESSDIPTVQAILQGLSSRPVRFFLVPHDLGDSAVNALEMVCTETGVSCTTWTAPDNPTPGTQAVVIARRGQLKELYRFANVAYVGGGYVRGKTHSIAEPALFGVPVVTGPEAPYSVHQRFVGTGARTANPVDPVRSVVDTIVRWLDNPETARAEGLKGRQLLGDKAAERTVDLITSLLAEPTVR